jgi:penicillin-binding protein 2
MEGVYLGTRGQRDYRYKTHASHLFGYMGAIAQSKLRELRPEGYTGRDYVGKTGLEYYYDDELRGARGVRKRSVDAAGHTLSTEIAQEPVPGNDLLLNIDMELQLATEKALAKSLKAVAKENGGDKSAAAAVVMDVNSGELLAMASLPNFDPRPFARGITSEEYSALLNDKNTPLVNRASHATFSPGSTYKMITGMAALQMSLANPHSRFFCGGAYKGANCFVRSGHGPVNFTNALAYSCDVVFYMLGDQMGIRNLARYSREAGLGSVTGIDLPNEDPGLIPDPEWKQEVWGEPWYGGDTINSSIGQGFILVTPLQMARVTAAVANGGTLYRPRLVDRITEWDGDHVSQNSVEKMGELPVSPGHLATVRSGMRGAVTRGTSTVVNLPNVKVAGKTGTVESFPNPYNPHGRNHTWFVCFAPYEKPEIAIAVFFQKSHGYGGSVAAPVAKEILEAYFNEGNNK